MGYRLRYQVNVDWVPEGVGPMSTATAALPLGGASAQTLVIQQAGFGPVSKTFVAADITALTNAMAADVAAQATTNIARVQNFATGQP